MDETGGWRFAQAFGDKGDIEEITEGVFSLHLTLHFNRYYRKLTYTHPDASGHHLGRLLRRDRQFPRDRRQGGRVVLFERNQSKQRAVEYKFYTEFQSHEPEFDYLKSLEIEEKINKIRWCGRQNSAHFLLSTNDKTIKLWKVFEKTLKVVSETNHYDGQTGRALPTPTARQHLRLPRSLPQDTIVAAVPRKVYANAHAYHIHSISVNSDQETYISADDLRINLWNLNVHDQSFNIVDIKPTNMEELTEVITTASFHPTQCNIFMYASSKAAIRMGDLRESAVCASDAGGGSGGAVRRFEDPPDPATTSFFSEIISSISDAQFSPDGMQILARDYLTLKLWDVRSEARPLRTISVHDHLKSKLCDLYENDCIFDKWECVWGAGGKQFLTGSYHNYFRVYDAEGDNDVVLQADKAVLRTKKGVVWVSALFCLFLGVDFPGLRLAFALPYLTLLAAHLADESLFFCTGKSAPRSLREAMQTEPQDFNKKILHASWHPREATVAIAATNSLFVYSAA
ncbi:Protein phosphatase PP2A regulatory subunit B [Mycena venus]|uniref:Protein phosphatase PP2A regulatory subunit B n=1 Tax=Mycena venus TaxID=2733690 RepID=A0A8H7CZ72_9AGAR|nr:Protein phosphatase PP2A regulatory subunit B [Mycena venus]